MLTVCPPVDGHVPFQPVVAAWVASAVTFTSYEPPSALSPADTNVTPGLVDDPPCANSFITPFGSLLNAVVNALWSNVNEPSSAISSPASPGDPGSAPGTMSVTASARSEMMRSASASPVSGDAVFVEGSYAVAAAMAACAVLAASTSACTLVASPEPSRLTVTVTGLLLCCFNCKVTPGITPLTVFDADVTS